MGPHAVRTTHAAIRIDLVIGPSFLSIWTMFAASRLADAYPLFPGLRDS
jgi:hypothetical protein